MTALVGCPHTISHKRGHLIKAFECSIQQKVFNFSDKISAKVFTNGLHPVLNFMEIPNNLVPIVDGVDPMLLV